MEEHPAKKTKLGTIAIVALLLVSLSVGLVGAQPTGYPTEKTTPILIPSDGSFTASEPNVGVMYEISGTPGATGTVTASYYNGEPQATAYVPDGVSLVHFVAVTIDMNAADFMEAKIFITLTDAELSGIKAPYTVYKYMPNSDGYVEVPATVNIDAKLATITLYSLGNTLYAVGGVPVESVVATPTTTWLILAGTVVAIIVAAVLLVTYLRRRSSTPVVVTRLNRTKRNLRLK